MTTSNGTDEPAGRLGAVLRAVGQVGPVALGKHGPWVATTLEDARRVLTTPEVFDFPTDVSRETLSRPDEDATNRSVHSITPPLSPQAVVAGAEVFVEQLAQVSTGELDAMAFLRAPVARSTTAAVLPEVAVPVRDQVADLVLAWIDALGPIIAASRPPRRWSRARRHESQRRLSLEAALANAGVGAPAAIAVVLAAGIQVPIAAGAWMLVLLAQNPEVQARLRQRGDLDRAVAWETVRLRPPTWITARVTRHSVELGATAVPAARVVMVSPLLLGQLEDLVPGQGTHRDFDPFRWDQGWAKPGAWLPFGAGPHACPGRNLGLAQLTALAAWARQHDVRLQEAAHINQSRGIFPEPARLHVRAAE